MQIEDRKQYIVLYLFVSQEDDTRSCIIHQMRHAHYDITVTAHLQFLSHTLLGIIGLYSAAASQISSLNFCFNFYDGLWTFDNAKNKLRLQ